MPHPWVSKATFTADGKITLSVEVTDLKDTTGAIEITGAATQENGAFASFYLITNITAAYNGGPDNPNSMFVDVVAVPAADPTSHPFAANLTMTVTARTSKWWASVLESGSGTATELAAGPAATAGATWAFVTDGQLGAT